MTLIESLSRLNGCFRSISTARLFLELGEGVVLEDEPLRRADLDLRILGEMGLLQSSSLNARRALLNELLRDPEVTERKIGEPGWATWRDVTAEGATVGNTLQCRACGWSVKYKYGRRKAAMRKHKSCPHSNQTKSN